jgi:hypothetical protein
MCWWESGAWLNSEIERLAVLIVEPKGACGVGLSVCNPLFGLVVLP